MKQGTEESQNTEPTNHFEGEGLRSLYLELENFKNIDKKIIDIGGHSLMVIGKNGSGKSSLIQAMTASLDAKQLPTEPIKKGEERARIVHKIGGRLHGEEVEYTIEIFFTPKNNKGRAVVYNKAGEQMKSPATIIKSAIGDVSFDVTKWLNDPKAKKLETIKKLTGCGAEVDKINLHIKEVKERLKAKKERSEELEGALKNHEFTQEEVEKYSTPVDLGPIQEELSKIGKAQQVFDGVVQKMNGFDQELKQAAETINRATLEIDRLNREILSQKQIIEQATQRADVANGNLAKGSAWLQNNTRPSIEEVNARLQVATIHNEKHARIGNLSFQHREKVKAMQEVEKLKVDVEKLEEHRSKIIAGSQLPIQGLTFTDDEIFVDGLPLEDGQINTASLFDVGVEVAMALNPNLKVIFLHDASLFDKEHLHTIVKKIEDRGYMAVCELVAENSDVETKFSETYFGGQ